MLIESFGGGLPAEDLSRSRVCRRLGEPPIPRRLGNREVPEQIIRKLTEGDKQLAAGNEPDELSVIARSKKFLAEADP